MDERHLRVVGGEADTTDETQDATLDLTGSEPVVDVTPEENPWTGARDRGTHPSQQDRSGRPPIRPTTGRDDRIRAYLRLVDGS